ncbi:MAG TPA: hypothetical protein VJ851_12750 [Jatrophihabitans sp.]|nr:hypothetical protein [Jatrophihabitans sp.]
MVMHIFRKITAAASLIGLTTAGFIALALPAEADATLQCQGSDRDIFCSLVGSGISNERWYFANVYYAIDDNRTSVSYRCSTGTSVGVRVTYTDSAGYESASDLAYCGNPPQ